MKYPSQRVALAYFGVALLLFAVVFVAMVAHSHTYIVNNSTSSLPLTDQVVLGKGVWEENACINCHSLHGEGAYFAPEVGNVMTR